MATIQEIEKRSFEELKAERDTLTEAARGETVDILAARYIKTLMDAKHRDEKLADQGRTIAALQDGSGVAQAELERLRGELVQANATLDSVRASARDTTQADKTAIGKLTESLAKQTERADRLKAAATRNHQAVAQAAALLNDALGSQAVEAADTGGES